MAYRSRSLERTEELKNPENRRIIQSYYRAHIDRMDEKVFFLEQKHPSLKPFFKMKREIKDPIENIEKTEATIKSFYVVEGLINIFADDDQKSQEIKEGIERLKPVKEIFMEYIPQNKGFYIAIAKSTKSVSRENGVSIDEAVRNLHYMDEIYRKTIPTRKKAEEFLRTSQLASEARCKALRGFCSFAKNSSLADKDLEQIAVEIPSVAQEKVIEWASWQYHMREFDRIYSE